MSVLLDEVRAVDTAGLALFAVSGRSKALAFGVSPVSALLLGTLSAIGGRVASDGWSRT